MKCDVLDKGFIDVVGTLGTDITVVNAARVSFGKRKPERDPLDEDDRKLLRYLAKHKHYSPFRHVVVQLHVKAPEFVMRQWYKHVVGIETTSSYPTKDHGWNEISGRYTDYADYYVPSSFRAQSQNNKQGSEGFIGEQAEVMDIYRWTIARVWDNYYKLLELGVAKEQARVILPLALYTEVYWTASFQAVANFLELRMDPHSQWEIQQYANTLYHIMMGLFPQTMLAWFGERHES